jgi:hypothetical protein
MKQRREPRGQPDFVLPPNLYNGPPGRGTFQFQIFIRTSSPEIWRKTIFGVRSCWSGKWGGLFWATSLEKIIGGVTAIVSYRPGGWMQQSTVPRCAILSVGSTGVTSSEAARIHHAAQRHCGGVIGPDARRAMCGSELKGKM